MKRKLSHACSQYGAQMGRRDIPATDKSLPHKLHLNKLEWVDGDYDQGGAYWGHNTGDSIYWYYGEDAEIQFEGFVRAKSRREAKELIREDYPNARFYR